VAGDRTFVSSSAAIARPSRSFSVFKSATIFSMFNLASYSLLQLLHRPNPRKIFSLSCFKITRRERPLLLSTRYQPDLLRRAHRDPKETPALQASLIKLSDERRTSGRSSRPARAQEHLLALVAAVQAPCRRSLNERGQEARNNYRRQTFSRIGLYSALRRRAHQLPQPQGRSNTSRMRKNDEFSAQQYIVE